jgi:hypothetical protein
MFCVQIVYLASIGGLGLDDTVRRIMDRLMTRELALKFNWKGRGKKRGFEALRVAKVLRSKRLCRMLCVCVCMF